MNLAEIARTHGQYTVEAYAFVGEGLGYAARHRDTEAGTADEDEASRHLDASELVEGVLRLASEQFGLLGTQVLRSWGVRRSEDIGHITFHLIEQGIFGKQSNDSQSDFDDGPAFAEHIQLCVQARLMHGTRESKAS